MKGGLIWIIGAAALWGTTGTAQALGPATSDPVGVGVVRLLLAGPVLIALAATAGVLPARRSISVIGLVSAALGMTAYQPFFFSAVRQAGVAVGTVVAIGSAPFLAGILAWMVHGERPSRRWWIATTVGALGIGFITGARGTDGAGPFGILLALAAGAAFAVYVVGSRSVVAHAQPVGGMAVVFATAAVLSLPLLLVVDLGWMASTSGVMMAAHLGLVATAAAYVLFAIGLRSTPAGPAATASLAEPLVAALLGLILLGEDPAAGDWVGMGLLLSALAVLTWRGGAWTVPLPLGRRRATPDHR